METLIPFALLCFTSFFTLTNPLGTMPVFLTMTQGMTERERRSVVSRATLVAFITIMVFTFAGQFLFKFFGISTNGFRIAGGVIIFKIGYDMLQARYTPMKLKDEEIKTYADDISITPLGIPMLCGPGAIANAIVLMQDANTFAMKGVLIGMIAFIYLLTFFILRASTRLVNVLGETGNNVIQAFSARTSATVDANHPLSENCPAFSSINFWYSSNFFSRLNSKDFFMTAYMACWRAFRFASSSANLFLSKESNLAVSATHSGIFLISPAHSNVPSRTTTTAGNESSLSKSQNSMTERSDGIPTG